MSPSALRGRAAAGAAAERLTRSAAKLEAEMTALSGLLGEEDAVDKRDKDSVKRKEKKLQEENAALKKVAHNMKAYAKQFDLTLPKETADPMMARLAAIGALLRASSFDEAADEQLLSEESASESVDQLMRRGGFAPAASKRGATSC